MSDTFSASDFETAAAEISAADTNTESTTEQNVEGTEQVTAEETVETVVADPAANTEVAAANTATTTANTEVQTTKEPPKEKWDQILENARTKARQEVETKYEWAKGVEAEEGQLIKAWVDISKDNPLQALDTLIRGLANGEATRPQLVEYLNRLMGPGQTEGAPSGQADDEMPQPDIPTDGSNGVPVVYSAQQTQKLLDWQRKQITAEFQKTMQPFEQERQQQREAADRARAQEALTKQASEYADKAIAQVADKPGFEDNKQEIVAAWSALPRDGRSEGELLFAAYLQVVMPKMSDKLRKDAVAAVTRKAGATTISPSSAGGTTGFDYDKATIAEALQYEYNIRKNRQ